MFPWTFVALLEEMLGRFINKFNEQPTDCRGYIAKIGGGLKASRRYAASSAYFQPCSMIFDETGDGNGDLKA